LRGQERSTGPRTPEDFAVQAAEASRAATDRAQTDPAEAVCTAAGGAPIEVHQVVAQTICAEAVARDMTPSPVPQLSPPSILVRSGVAAPVARAEYSFRVAVANHT
jgi:hypothetical protein